MTGPVLDVRELSHQYGDVQAVSNVSFQTTDSGIVALLGANGAGKSTIMNVICDSLRATSGSVRIDGIDARQNNRDYKKNIGYLPQQAPLYHELTVKEYLVFAAALRDVGPKYMQSAVDSTLERCGLQGHSNRIIGTLSGGYRQRVGLAQSIIHNPKLIVLDEPTNGLDPLQMIDVRRLIQDIGAERTVLISTHILSEIEAMNAHVLMLKNGNLVFSGEVRDLKRSVGRVPVIVKFRGEAPNPDQLKIQPVKSISRVNVDTLSLDFGDVIPDARAILDKFDRRGLVVEEIYKDEATLEHAFKRIVLKSNKATG